MRQFLSTARCWALVFALVLNPSQAAEVSVAVASNFSGTLQKIAAAFAQDTGHKVVPAFGSTGALYAQIKNGAPFQVFLAADDETPALREKEGLAVAGSRFTYATGRLALWSANPAAVDSQGAILRSGRFERIALPNPKLAPYGRAAMETLATMGLAQSLAPRMVQGENVTQSYQFIRSGNAVLGFVALSQIYQDGQLREGSVWSVPAQMHAPIQQDAVLLEKGRSNPAALAWMAYLRGDKARALVQAAGYDP
jgi:molybdate transport system substrate-binding protein